MSGEQNLEEPNHDPRPRWLREHDADRDRRLELLEDVVKELVAHNQRRQGVYLTGRAVAVIITTLAAGLVVVTAIARLFV